MSGVVRVPAAPGSKASPDAPAGHHPSGYDPSRDAMITIGGKEYQRFQPTHKKIKDGTSRCIACGQIDEPEYHQRKWCPGRGGWLPFPTSKLKMKLRSDSGFCSDSEHRITLEQWVLISRILADPNKIARDIVSDDEAHVGYAYSTVQELLKVEAHTDDNGTVWTPPTAWAYFAACRALNARDSDGNPKGGDGTAPSQSDDSAGLQGIAQPAAHPQPVGSETATDAAKREGEA